METDTAADYIGFLYFQATSDSLERAEATQRVASV